MKKLLITGSNSELARLFIDDYGNKFELSAISTRKKIHSKYIKKLIILDYKDPNIYSLINDCDYILHYAWSRKNFNNQENIKLINFLLQAKKKTAQIYFISSASASRESLSLYGKQKFEISEIILNNNQVNIILGLPKNNDSYQYKLLSKSLKLLPFSLRFTKNFVNVYTIDLKKFNEKLFCIINSEIKNRNIFIVDEIKTINEFISSIENKRSIKIIFPVVIFTLFLKLLSTVNLCITRITSKQGKLDKLLTFFNKDDVYLSRILKNQNEDN